MRIAVLGTARSGTDPRTVRLVVSLASAGHDVAFVSAGAVDDRIEAAATWTVRVDTRWPPRTATLARVLRRLNPGPMRARNARNHVTAVLSNLRPDLVYVPNRELAELADGLGFVVTTDTAPLRGSSRTLADVAPERPDVAGFVDDGTPWVRRDLTRPVPGRHAGRRIVLCYHPTDTTPARYLRAALERAGVAVAHHYPSIDLTTVPDDVDGVVFVESPYPALDVTGTTKAPIVFWVHHGEHHLYQNLRLTDRYRVDAVLLAHSWHLAHRFPVPVHRFPFAAPTEMLDVVEPFESRSLEAAMVASGFEETTDRYTVRRRLAQQLTSRFGPDRVRFVGGVSPETMFALYGDAKLVLDEGGSRHRPITMRVFEATASGAALLTDPAPGLADLFDDRSEVVTFDPRRGVPSLPAVDDLRTLAEAGRRRALGVHTYDHRVDELLEILGTVGKRPASDTSTPSAVRGIVERYAEIDTVACADPHAGDLAEALYTVWSHDDVRNREITVDAVVIDGDDRVDSDLVTRAHRYVLCSPLHASTVRTMLDDDGRTFTETADADVVVFDLHTPGYIVRDPS